ncbi:MAG: alpha/beta fold hydrolase [Deltaproteobacteria bacterium]|nr:alpha/beta fold hydrolase [Deltaproteobacteria bacterium]
MHHNPQIDPIFKRGTNGAGVLLIHGFTGTPDSMRPLANALHAEGFTVSAPLLAGHGTTVEDCAKYSWPDWFQTVQKSYMELHEKCSKIFVAGLSLGALLTLKLAIEFPQSLSGLACLATPLYLKPWVRRVLPVVWHTPLRRIWRIQKKFGVDIKDESAKENFWNYDAMPISCSAGILELQALVRETLSKIQTPLLLIHSRHDSTAPFNSMAVIAKEVASPVTESVVLENSYHVITLDYDKDLLNQKVCAFFRRFL